MCIFFAVVVMFTRSLSEYWPKWKRYVFWAMVASGVMGIVGSSSRGALVGLAALALWMLAKSRYKVRGLLATGVLALAVYKLLPPEQIARLQSMGTDDTSTSRTELWRTGSRCSNRTPYWESATTIGRGTQPSTTVHRFSRTTFLSRRVPS